MHIYWANVKAFCPSWLFLPKDKELEGGKDYVFCWVHDSWVLYIAFALAKLCCLSLAFSTPGQITRGMRNTSVHTKKKEKWEKRKHGKVVSKE